MFRANLRGFECIFRTQIVDFGNGALFVTALGAFEITDRSGARHLGLIGGLDGSQPQSLRLDACTRRSGIEAS